MGVDKEKNRVAHFIGLVFLLTFLSGSLSVASFFVENDFSTAYGTGIAFGIILTIIFWITRKPPSYMRVVSFFLYVVVSAVAWRLAIQVVVDTLNESFFMYIGGLVGSSILAVLITATYPRAFPRVLLVIAAGVIGSATFFENDAFFIGFFVWQFLVALAAFYALSKNSKPKLSGGKTDL